ncbi:ATP-binding cassette domain-containing protein [Microbacterium sp. No. 7]|uniref:ATP-binding cassette domain-containing protein n=1 Tax=Microbacterium sp. No. 7 TaxID=1714373 RepID=UPI0006CF542D|nr:ATP-binding cassette domain-containing protein [Microbacterium sp. No. 7]ALJ20073.1 peptide ABC transporter ATP-binding protein [Microbacterium sp. No. 7]
MSAQNDDLLVIDDLAVNYRKRGLKREIFQAVRGASLRIGKGETLGLVGESGSGKTTIGRAVLGLAPVSEGRILLEGRDISHLSRRARRGLSNDVQVVFQDPYSSLNPSMTVGDILAEPLSAQGVSRRDARTRIDELLDQVGLPAGALDRLPREFSGGQRQRVAIARALSLSPKLIVCDEPVSALDLTTQARILDLLLSIQNETKVSYLFISHDLDVVRHLSHRVAVIYRGDIVEQGDALQVTDHPQHPYTKKLLFASPLLDPEKQAERRAERRRMLAAEAAAS